MVSVLEKTSPPANKAQLQADKLKSDVLKKELEAVRFQLLQTVPQDLELVQRLKAERGVSRKVRGDEKSPETSQSPKRRVEELSKDLKVKMFEVKSGNSVPMT